MRRTLCLFTVLATVISIGCSRQPQPHVGEWDAKYYSPTDRSIIGEGVAYFTENGTAQFIIYRSGKEPIVIEGQYEFDPSKNPEHLNIVRPDNDSLLGLVRTVGEDKSQMQILLSKKGEPRPKNFTDNVLRIWLTKKVKK